MVLQLLGRWARRAGVLPVLFFDAPTATPPAGTPRAQGKFRPRPPGGAGGRQPARPRGAPAARSSRDADRPRRFPFAAGKQQFAHWLQASRRLARVSAAREGIPGGGGVPLAGIGRSPRSSPSRRACSPRGRALLGERGVRGELPPRARLTEPRGGVDAASSPCPHVVLPVSVLRTPVLWDSALP